jgi:glycosyltransferase involved in cell wall biosynthesis
VRDDAGEPELREPSRVLDVVPVRQPTIDARARAQRIASFGRGILTREPPNPWAQQHRAAGFDEAVMRAARQFAPDAVLLRSTFAHLIAPLRSTTRRLAVDAHDSDALFALTLKSTAKPWQRPALHLRHLNAERAERAFERADELWVPASRELTYFQTRSPALPLVLVPNGVPVTATPPPRDPDGRTLLLFGAFGMPMNLAAADARVDEILPDVLAVAPDCRVELLGTDLPADRLERWRELPVHWLGRVDDLQPHLARAQVFVFAPTAGFGSGTPLKVSEALAAGIPVATTPVIGEELGLVGGDNAIVAEDPRALARGIARLLREPDLADSVGVAGHARARELLSFESVLARTRSESALADLVT